jgi:hypothetical protein
MPIIRDAAELSAPRLKEALLYWQGKRAGRAMPARRDFDPVEVPKLLPYVMLYDVLTAPLDFRYRLIGTEARSLLSQDYTGKRFSEVAGKGAGSVIWDNCEQVVRAKAPFSRAPPYIGPEPHLRNCENLLMPFSEDGDAVNLIVQVISFERRRV